MGKSCSARGGEQFEEQLGCDGKLQGGRDPKRVGLDVNGDPSVRQKAVGIDDQVGKIEKDGRQVECNPGYNERKG